MAQAAALEFDPPGEEPLQQALHVPVVVAGAVVRMFRPFDGVTAARAGLGTQIAFALGRVAYGRMDRAHAGDEGLRIGQPAHEPAPDRHGRQPPGTPACSPTVNTISPTAASATVLKINTVARHTKDIWLFSL